MSKSYKIILAVICTALLIYIFAGYKTREDKQINITELDLARQALVQSKFDIAQQHLITAERLSPHNAEIALLWGHYHWQAHNDLVQAENYYRRAAKLDSNLKGHLHNFLLNTNIGDWRAAL